MPDTPTPADWMIKAAEELYLRSIISALCLQGLNRERAETEAQELLVVGVLNGGVSFFAQVISRHAKEAAQ